MYWYIPSSTRRVKDKNAKNSDTQVLAENKHHAARVTFKVYLHFYINKHFTEVRLNLKRQGMVEHYMVWYMVYYALYYSATNLFFVLTQNPSRFSWNDTDKKRTTISDECGSFIFSTQSHISFQIFNFSLKLKQCYF